MEQSEFVSGLGGVLLKENSKLVVTKSSFAMMRVAAFETVIYVLCVCVCV